MTRPPAPALTSEEARTGAAGERVEAVARALARHLVGLQDVNGQPNYTARVAAAAAIAALEPSPAEEAHGPLKCVSVEDANRVLAEARGSAAAIAQAAWSEGYEACYRGEQRYRNPYRAALASPAPAPQDANGCPDQPHHGVDCPGDACRYAAPAAQLPQCNLPICPEGDGDHRITTGRCIVAPAPQGERVPWLESISPDSCGHTDREGCTGHGDF